MRNQEKKKRKIRFPIRQDPWENRGVFGRRRNSRGLTASVVHILWVAEPRSLDCFLFLPVGIIETTYYCYYTQEN